MLCIFVWRMLEKAVCKFQVIWMKKKSFMDFSAKIVNFEKMDNEDQESLTTCSINSMER